MDGINYIRELNMTLYESIKDLQDYKKKVTVEYRMEQAKADFDNVKRPSKKSFYTVKMVGYIQNEIYPLIDKIELSRALHYFMSNIPLNQTNEYKYLNDKEIKLLEIICTFALTNNIKI
jgi:hypothetical protein